MERFEIGDVIQLRKNYSSSAQLGYLFEVLDFNNDTAVYKCILPYTEHRIRVNHVFNGEKDDLIDVTTLNKDDVLKGRYILRSNEHGYHIVYNDEWKVKTEKVSEKLNINILKSIFKYIPIKYKGENGFYYNNKIIFKTFKPKKFSPSGRLYKDISNRKIVKIVECNDDSCLSMFSVESLQSQCLFKVKDYKLSSKLFGFTESKKLMIDQIVDISKIEFQADVKKSDKRENTVYIKVEEKNLRFSLEDIEIIYPNVNGWCERKNRIIKNGSQVKLIKNKDFKDIPKGTVIKVNNIKVVGNKKYIGFEYKNKELISKINNFKLA